jgi:hypothetical protein
MNATGPPGNANAALAERRRGKLIAVPGGYHGSVLFQSGIIWRRWELEAGRLLGLFWRSGNLRHFHAFVRHVHAMRGRQS